MPEGKRQMNEEDDNESVVRISLFEEEGNSVLYRESY